MFPKSLFIQKNLNVDRDIVFQEDISNFYKYIESSEKLEDLSNFSYLNFKLHWKSKKMSLIHFIKSKEESIKEYYEVLYGEIQSINKLKLEFLFSENINLRIFSIFSLYSIYFTQPYLTKYQINTIPGKFFIVN